MDKIWNQQPGEDYESWKWRLLLAKARHETHGLSWSDIAKMLNLPYTEEHLRKECHGIYLYDEYLRSQRGELDENVQQQLDTLQRQKIQMQDQRRMARRDLREAARLENLQETVRDAVKTLKPMHIKFSQRDTKNDAEGVLLLSDWHVGMVTCNAVNQYNTVIFWRRLQEVAQQTIENCRLHNIGHLHVFALGDLVHGLIHVTARIESEEDVVKQCMSAAEGVCALIGVLLDAGIGISLYWSRGNHERVSANRKESIARESFSDMILWYLKARLEGVEGISFKKSDVQDDEIVMTEIAGHKIAAVHGHKDKPQKAVRNIAAVTRVLPDIVLMGHFHSSADREIDGAEVVVNGSLCGVDDFAMSLRCTGRPSQTLLVIDKRGIVARYNLLLQMAASPACRAEEKNSSISI